MNVIIPEDFKAIPTEPLEIPLTICVIGAFQNKCNPYLFRLGWSEFLILRPKDLNILTVLDVIRVYARGYVYGLQVA